jgi:hypothetical protein
MTRLLEDDGQVDFKINTKFAEKYQEKKEKEELSICMFYQEY